MAEKRQRLIGSFFSLETPSKQKKSAQTDDSKPCTTSSSESKGRKYRESWSKEFSWLVYDEQNHVIKCKFCCALPHLAGGSDFVKGSTTFKKESLMKHNESGKHKNVRDTILGQQKSKGVYNIQQCLKLQQRQHDLNTIVDLKLKLTTAYTIAKEELPFTKFKPLLEMQRKNGLDVNKNYENDVKCAEIISCISETLKMELANKMIKSEFYSIMIDAGTDVSVKENEAINVRYVCAGQPETKLLGLVELEHAHAEGKIY